MRFDDCDFLVFIIYTSNSTSVIITSNSNEFGVCAKLKISGFEVTIDFKWNFFLTVFICHITVDFKYAIFEGY